ncbi:hypothetical protein HY388_02650 [Candidatus Daviesbacteria bacterium]|nr:hypothetical protein [Candidatus Daviesbacteria bacterium]
MNKFFLVIVLVLSGFLTYKELIFKGYFPMHDDLQVMRIFEMSKCFADGQIPCRWVPDMGYEYGYPLFNYYPPFAYYIGTAIHSFGVGLFDSVKILFFLQFTISGVLMYFFARRFWGSGGGFLSALFYMYAPYRAVDVYVRGAMAESWALAFAPGIFWMIDKIITEKKWRDVFWLGFFYAGVLLSHNLMTLLFVPLTFLWIILRLVQERAFWQIPKIVAGGLYGGALAAFFTVVVLLETKYVHVETLFMGYFNYLAHFVDINQLFFSDFWGYGGSVWGPEDSLSFSVGYLHWILVVFSFFTSIILLKQKQFKTAIIILFFFIVFWLSTFLMHYKAAPIWEMLTFLQNLQFPWRILSVTIFVASFLAGSIFSLKPYVSTKILRTFLVVAALGVIILNYQYFKPATRFYVDDNERLSGELWRFAITSGIFDYLPKDAKFPPAAAPSEQVEVLSGDVRVENYASGSASVRFLTKSNQGARVRMALYEFPTWDVKIDGKNTSHGPGGDLGRITFNIPPGDHSVSIKLIDTPVRTITNLVSLAAWLTFVGFLIALFKKPKFLDKIHDW